MADDPVRLLDEGGSELMRSLLSAAREEHPREAALRRTLTAVGVGASVVAASTSASGAAGVKGALGTASLGSAKAVASTTVLIVGKWLAVGAVGGLLATSAAYGVKRALSAPAHSEPMKLAVQRENKPLSKPARELREQPAEGLTAPAPSAVLSAPVVAALPGALPSNAMASAAAPSAGVPLAAEVLALDGVRQAIESGNADRALELLNGYDAHFPAPRMLPEALYLRLEAFTLKGDAMGSAAAAQRLLRLDPSNAHSARARAVLGLDKQ